MRIKTGWLLAAILWVIAVPGVTQTTEPPRSLPKGSVPNAGPHRGPDGRIVGGEPLRPGCTDAAAIPSTAQLKPVDILLLGDSITAGWPPAIWNRHFGTYETVNAGVPGWTTEHLLKKVCAQGLDAKPRLAIVMIGTNNINAIYNHRDTEVDIARNVKSIAANIRILSPGSKVLLLAVLPRGELPSSQVRRVVENTNRLFPPIADAKTIFYADVGRAVLTPEGVFAPAVTPDEGHLTERGYELFAAALEPIVKDLLRKAN